jgi:hypothetical protein
VKAGKGKGGSLMEFEDYDYESAEPSSAEEVAAYFARVDAHLKATNALEGEALEGDPLLIFCNGQAYEMDPSAGVTTLTSLNGANEAEEAAKGEEKDPKISLTMSAPLIATIDQVLKTSTVPPAPAEIMIWFNGEQEPDEAVRNMNAESAKAYGLSVTWLAGLDLAAM